MIKFESGIEIYHNTGDTLPTEGIPASSIALNMDDWTASIYNGILWVPKGSKMVETELVNGTFTFTALDGAYRTQDITVALTEGKTYSVVLDGVEYSNLKCFRLEAGNASSILVIGLKSAEEEYYTTYPFVYQNATMTDGSKTTVFATNIEGNSHNIVIKTYEVQGV